MVNKKEMALRGQTLFDKIKIDYQIFNQELEKCMCNMKQVLELSWIVFEPNGTK
jgi:hypothetical protein